MLQKIWIEAAGKKFALISKIYDIIKDDRVIIACKDSVIANELYLKKDKILQKMEEKAAKLGIKIKDVEFSYKKWE